MPVRNFITCNCLNCARLTDHYWASSTTHIIKCRNIITGQIEMREYHPLDNLWCPRWQRRLDDER